MWEPESIDRPSFQNRIDFRHSNHWAPTHKNEVHPHNPPLTGYTLVDLRE